MRLGRPELWELLLSIFKFTLSCSTDKKQKRTGKHTHSYVQSIQCLSETWKHNTLFCAAHYLHAKGLAACQWTVDYLRLSILDAHIQECSGDKRPYLRPYLQVKAQQKRHLTLDTGRRSRVLSLWFWGKPRFPLSAVMELTCESVERDKRRRENQEE